MQSKVESHALAAGPRRRNTDLEPELDLSRYFLPECLVGLATGRVLEEDDRRALNQIRASSYLHLFDLFESLLSRVVHARASADVEVREALEPLLRLDMFDHHELFRSFEAAFEAVFPVVPKHVTAVGAFEKTLEHASPLSLLALALHFKLVTQQHYLACVRGDEQLEPHFVRVLKDHWTIECGASGRASGSGLAIQHALARALPGRIPSALRDYRLLVFACDDVLHTQSELDLETLEQMRVGALPTEHGEREALLVAEMGAHRKSFLTMGIVNAAFIYAMRSLGPTAPAALAGVVSALSARA